MLEFWQFIGKHFVVTENGFGFSWAVGMIGVILLWITVAILKVKITKREQGR